MSVTKLTSRPVATAKAVTKIHFHGRQGSGTVTQALPPGPQKPVWQFGYET